MAPDETNGATQDAQARLHALLDQGATAARRGQQERARRFFEAALALDAENEEAWLWLAAMTEDRGLARAIYQRVLQAHPQSTRAQEALRWLDLADQQAQEPAPTSAEAKGTPTAAESGAGDPTPMEAAPSSEEADGPALFVPPWERESVLSHSVSAPAEAAMQGQTPSQPAASPLPAQEASAPAEIAPPQEMLTAPSTAAPQEEEPSAMPSTEEAHAAQSSAEPAAAEPAPTPARPVSSPELPRRAPLRRPAGAGEHPPAPAPQPGGFTPMRPAPRPAERGAANHIWRDALMLLMLGFVLLGSLGLIFLARNEERTHRVRAALGVFTKTPTITLTPSITPSPTVTPSPTTPPTATPTLTLTPSLTPTPTQTLTPSPTFTASPTATPAWITQRYLPLPLEEKWIEVDLSEQKLYAYEGITLVFTTTISSGRTGTPTVQGKFRIQRKYLSQLMTGPGYYLPNVPYVMYFYGNFALHGAYWHNNWGTPMSHGCVNLRREDAKWLFEWTDPKLPAGHKEVMATKENPGTWVLVHE